MMPAMPEPYEAGTLGPAAADALLAHDDHSWHELAPAGQDGPLTFTPP